MFLQSSSQEGREQNDKRAYFHRSACGLKKLAGIAGRSESREKIRFSAILKPFYSTEKENLINPSIPKIEGLESLDAFFKNCVKEIVFQQYIVKCFKL